MFLLNLQCKILDKKCAHPRCAQLCTTQLKGEILMYFEMYNLQCKIIDKKCAHPGELQTVVQRAKPC